MPDKGCLVCLLELRRASAQCGEGRLLSSRWRGAFLTGWCNVRARLSHQRFAHSYWCKPARLLEDPVVYPHFCVNSVKPLFIWSKNCISYISEVSSPSEMNCLYPSFPFLPPTPKGCHIPCKIREIPNTTHKQKSSIYHAKGAGGRLALQRICASTEFNILKWVKGSEFVFLRVEMSRSRQPRSLSSAATSHASRRPRRPVMIKASHDQSLLIQGSFSTPYHKSRERWWRLCRVMCYLPVLGRRTLAVALMVFVIMQRSANTSARKFYHC